MSPRMQPRNEKFFTLFSKASSNAVESAAILMEFAAAPHERWAKLAKRRLHTEHAGDDTTQVCQARRILKNDAGSSTRALTLNKDSPPTYAGSIRTTKIPPDS